MLILNRYSAAVYIRFAAVSRAARDAAAVADIRFVWKTYYSRSSTHKFVASSYRPNKASGKFARRNADRVTSLGGFMAPNIASIWMYNGLRNLEIKLGSSADVALLPRFLTKLVVRLRIMRIKWENFQLLCCLQELQVHNDGSVADIEFQLDDSFVTALPLLRKFHISPAMHCLYWVALKTTAKVFMPHLVELSISYVKIVHLDLHFMNALNNLSLVGCTAVTVSAACSTMRLEYCCMDKRTVFVSPNLRSLTIHGGGVHKLDGSRCRHALSIFCKASSIEWVGAKPSVDNLREVRW